MLVKLEWIPLQRLGDFKFGESIEPYIEPYGLYSIPDEYENSVGWDVYGMENIGIRIYTENGVITSIACYEECLYEGKNLIGMELVDVVSVIKVNPSADVDIIEIDNEPQEVYEFDDIEAQVWVKNGKVVTIFCGPRCEE